MPNKPIDDVLDTLAQMPKFHRGLHRNIFRKVIENVAEGITRHHLEILNLLYDEKTLHMAEIADMLLISKSQMTRLIDELINLEMVERHPDKNDRRKSNIVLTPKGSKTVEEFKRGVEDNTKIWLSSLNDEELSRIAASLKQIQNSVMKLSRSEIYQNEKNI
ncbi:MAG: MarR family transcriptional regulator [Dehalococcoidia bacterium]